MFGRKKRRASSARGPSYTIYYPPTDEPCILLAQGGEIRWHRVVKDDENVIIREGKSWKSLHIEMDTRYVL